MQKYLIYILLISAMVLASCGDRNGAEEKVGITFSSSLENEMKQTRAGDPTKLASDFVAFGYKKNASDAAEVVFDGYTIAYGFNTAGTSEDNTDDYHYVGIDNTSFVQTIKYWDFGATEYHFWGCTNVVIDGRGAPTEKQAEFNAAGTSLTIPVQLTKEEDPEAPKFSELRERKPVKADVVQLRFLRPYAKICVQFYTNEGIPDESQYHLTDITFGPDPDAVGAKIYTKGELQVTYPKICDSDPVKEQVLLVPYTEEPTLKKFPYLDVVLDKTHGTASNNAVTALIPDGKVWQLGDMPGETLAPARQRVAMDSPVRDHYYVLPMGVAANEYQNPAFVLHLNLEGEPRTAVVPMNFMQWKPNFHYTYIFKLTDVGRRIEFYDVKVEDWVYGGSQDETWRNW